MRLICPKCNVESSVEEWRSSTALAVTGIADVDMAGDPSTAEGRVANYFYICPDCDSQVHGHEFDIPAKEGSLLVGHHSSGVHYIVETDCSYEELIHRLGNKIADIADELDTNVPAIASNMYIVYNDSKSAVDIWTIYKAMEVARIAQY